MIIFLQAAICWRLWWHYMPVLGIPGSAGILISWAQDSRLSGGHDIRCNSLRRSLAGYSVGIASFRRYSIFTTGRVWSTFTVAIELDLRTGIRIRILVISYSFPLLPSLCFERSFGRHRAPASGSFALQNTGKLVTTICQSAWSICSIPKKLQWHLLANQLFLWLRTFRQGSTVVAHAAPLLVGVTHLASVPIVVGLHGSKALSLNFASGRQTRILWQTCLTEVLVSRIGPFVTNRIPHLDWLR